jgi:hypothetical protein
MKTFNIAVLALSIMTLTVSCSKENDTSMPLPSTNTIINTVLTEPNFNFKYKVFYKKELSSSTVKGLVVLAVGDGGTENDTTLNDQCTALANEGYVAITTTYRPLDGVGQTWEVQGALFRADMMAVITKADDDYGIPFSKTIVGGLSRGGNMTMSLILPGQYTYIAPFSGIKGALLQCSGGDAWKGSAVLFPVAWMSNKVDNVMGVINANDFKNGLQNNTNLTVKTQSECLIYNSDGHCGDSSGNKNFMVSKVKQWLP